MRPLLFALVFATFALDAWATPNFPAALRAAESLPSMPDCTLCHRGAPQAGTVTTPFGISMRQRGLVMYDEESLRAALAAMRADAVDSDGDGTPDLDELAAGTDPNVAPRATSPDAGTLPAQTTFPEPIYGCSAGAGSTGAAPWMALAALGAWAVRRSRGRSVPPSAYVPSNVNSGRKN